ncbi:hypothetical protein D3C87_2189020 [compost metagenome]
MAKSAFFTLIKARLSPGSIEMSSFTTAIEAFEPSQYFSYFLFPINEISEVVAFSSCSVAVTHCEVVP